METFVCELSFLTYFSNIVHCVGIDFTILLEKEYANDNGPTSASLHLRKFLPLKNEQKLQLGFPLVFRTKYSTQKL